MIIRESKIIPRLFILVVLFTSAAYAQQQFVQAVTKENKNCNAVCSVIDIPELNGNPSAVIFVTPVGNTASLNPHPIGLYYMYLKKWSVFNLDGIPIPDGAKYSIEYYAQPDANHFTFLVKEGGGTCVDRAGLNGNSSAEAKVFPASSPTRGAWFNDIPVKFEYNARRLKWCLSGVDGSGVKTDTAYNIAFSGGPAISNPNVSSGINANPQTQSSSAPSPQTLTPITNIAPTQGVGSTLPVVNAGGDLNGYYPNPTVIGFQGRPLSSVAPSVGQLLIWNGSKWAPAAPWKTFFKDDVANQIDVPSNTFMIFPTLSHTIVLTTRSRLVVSGMIEVYGANYGPLCSSYDCKPSNGYFEIQINGNRTFTLAVASPGAARLSFTISNFMIDLNPGTYNVEFGLRNVFYTHNQSMNGRPIQSSIIVIPLE